MAEKNSTEPGALYKELTTKPFIIAGPCVAESRQLLDEVAAMLLELQNKYKLPFIFKASFDKANRTSVDSFRGPGLRKGLEELTYIKEKYNLPVTSDIHESWQAEQAGKVLDIIQIPAFLCRQTDLLIAAAETGKIVNIKKAQFLSGQDMQWAVEKVKAAGNDQIMLTERGNMFGYNNLVVDFRNILDMKVFGFPVIMDATHAVQRPGGAGGKSGGNREYVPYMAKAAKSFGANGYFFEVHPDPDNALSDGPNMLNFKGFETLLEELLV